MEPFMRMFFSIDKDFSETITRNELLQYVKENNLDDGMVTRWQTLFDPEHTGLIKFDTFCDVLGIKPEQARIMRNEQQASSRVLASDIQVVSENMNLNDQIDISEHTKSLVLPPSELDENTILIKLKEWLDRKYGPYWNVCITEGSYWITYAHIEKCSFQFRLNGKAYIIWRTLDS